MTQLLLTTKLYFPPPRSNLVPRPRLVERLESGLQGPLTLISAPAGSGKTTLLSEWRAGTGAGIPLAWLSLDAADNDLTRFLHYLCATLDTIHPGLAEQVLPLLQTQEPPRAEPILTLVINALNEVSQDFILALDDYHLIETATIHAGLTFLLDHLPRRMHLVIVTRADPPLPLSRLRGRGQLTEIRAEHLRFTTEESENFLCKVMGLGLTSADVAALEARTEGWIAGLQLAALSMQGCDDLEGFISAFAGSHHYIVDYLAEEVLSRQPEAIRDFLMKTSILERITGSLCEALTGEVNSDGILERLDHANLFVIPLDNDQYWYRYHHLFADLLRSRLVHASPSLVLELQNKAAEWMEEHGFIDEAIHHALAAENYGRAKRLICDDTQQVMYTRSISTLETWLRAFPENTLRSDPWLCLAKAHVLWATGQRDNIKPYFECAEQALAELVATGQISVTDAEYLTLRGDIFTFQSMEAIGQGDPVSAVALAQKAVSTIPKTTRNYAFTLGSLYIAYQLSGEIDKTIETCLETVALSRSLDYPSMHATACYTLAQMLRVKGQLHRAAQVLGEALEHAERQGQARMFYYGFVHIGLAQTLYEWNALDEMEAELDIGIALCRQGGPNILELLGRFDQVRLKQAQRDLHGALDLVDEIERDCIKLDPRAYRDDCTNLRLRIKIELGDHTGLDEWIRQADLNIGTKISTDRFFVLYSTAYFLTVLDRAHEALQILNNLETRLEQAGYSGWLVFTKALHAVAWRKMSDDSRAVETLQQALSLAESEGYVRVFQNLGEPMKELLLLLNKKGDAGEHALRILSAFQAPSAQRTAQPLAKKSEPLSKRELELLALIAAGHSNKEIASELYIAIGTVKRHTANIFTN